MVRDLVVDFTKELMMTSEKQRLTKLTGPNGPVYLDLRLVRSIDTTESSGTRIQTDHYVHWVTESADEVAQAVESANT